MPVIKSAIKRLARSRKQAVENKKVRTKLRKIIGDFRRKPEKKVWPTVVSVIDKAAKKRVIHRHKASRLKSRLAKLL